MNTVPQELLKSLFDYREDGNLLWIARPKYSNFSPGSVAGGPHPPYWRVSIDRKFYLLHRLVYAWHTGQWPDRVDHKDRDSSNNRFENLRPITQSNNVVNSDGTWGKVLFRGVYRNTQANKFQARIMKEGKSLHLGFFKDPEEASEVYEKARARLFPEIYVELHASRAM